MSNETVYGTIEVSDNFLPFFFAKYLHYSEPLGFARLFVSEIISSSGNYNVLNKKTIGELYDIKDIENKVAEITAADLDLMNDTEKEAIQLFRNPPKNSHFN